jgi:hypothetical protein
MGEVSAVMLLVIVGLPIAVCILGFLCNRVLKGRNGLEAMSVSDLDRRALQSADAAFHEMHVSNAQNGGFTGF